MASITPPQWPNITPRLSGPAGHLARGGGDWPSWQHLWPDSQPDLLEQQGSNQDGGLGRGSQRSLAPGASGPGPECNGGGVLPEMITAEGGTAPPRQSATWRPKPPAWRTVAQYSPGDRGVKRLRRGCQIPEGPPETPETRCKVATAYRAPDVVWRSWRNPPDVRLP